MSGQQNEACILLAEDNPGDVVLVEYALKAHAIKYKLLLMSDGTEALRFIRHLALDSTMSVPDLFLLDFHLPKHDSEEIVRHIRASGCWADMAVVVMSSSSSPKDKADALRYSAHYFQKPSDLVDFMKLGAIVKEALSDARERHT